MNDLVTRLLALAEKAVDEALQLDYGDPEDRDIYRERQELRQLVQQQAEGPTDEELLRCYGLAKRNHCYEGPMDDWPKRAELAATVFGLRAVIAADRAQWGSPKVKPVPAAEKPWEQDGWCDAAGCCWFFWPEHVNDNLGDVSVIEPPIWEYRKPEAVELYPFSLPHDAISLPSSNHDDQHGLHI